MFRIFSLFLALVSIAWSENSLTRQEKKEGFELLFDGKRLGRWHSIKLGPDAAPWRVRKGILTYEKGESWLATDETYVDFVLRLEYRTGAGSDSGIFLRSSATGDPAFTGMELEIKSDAGRTPDTHSTGALYGVVAASKTAGKPAGEWNQVEASLIRRQLVVVWNGQEILDVNLDDPKFAGAEHGPLSARALYGHIGLQAHGNGAPVEFRNIRLKVLKIGPLFGPKPNED